MTDIIMKLLYLETCQVINMLQFSVFIHYFSWLKSLERPKYFLFSSRYFRCRERQNSNYFPSCSYNNKQQMKQICISRPLHSQHAPASAFTLKYNHFAWNPFAIRMHPLHGRPNYGSDLLHVVFVCLSRAREAVKRDCNVGQGRKDPGKPLSHQEECC